MTPSPHCRSGLGGAQHAGAVSLYDERDITERFPERDLTCVAAHPLPRRLIIDIQQCGEDTRGKGGAVRVGGGEVDAAVGIHYRRVLILTGTKSNKSEIVLEARARSAPPSQVYVDKHQTSFFSRVLPIDLLPLCCVSTDSKEPARDCLVSV